MLIGLVIKFIYIYEAILEMSRLSVVSLKSVLVLFGLSLLTACGGGSGIDIAGGRVQSQQFIAGAGIKGPLAFASVDLYALDTRFEKLFDPSNPVSSATTNAYAEISRLSVPLNVAPPYIMVIDGSNAIDRNTGEAPVIKKLITVITQDTLDQRKPVYATPYTTLAFNVMAQTTAHTDGSVRGTLENTDVTNTLSYLNFRILQSIGFGLSPAETDIFTTPPVITGRSSSLSEQQLVVNYRAAIEALSSMLNDMAITSEFNFATDTILETLAIDLDSDWKIDNSYRNGISLASIDLGILSRDPLGVSVPNTDYKIRDIVDMMEEERALIADSSGVTFFKDDIVLNLIPFRTGVFFQTEAANETVAETTTSNGGSSNSTSSNDSGNSTGSTSSNGSNGTKSSNGSSDSTSSNDTIGTTSSNGSSGSTSTNDSNSSSGSSVDNSTNAVILAGGLLAPTGNTGNLIFHTDFENRLANTTYTEAQLKQDFNANDKDGKVHGPDNGNTRIVSDPGNTGRGNVLRTRHRAGQFGQAASFKARFAPDNENKKGSARFDDVYLSYDIYLSPNTERMPYHKIPGLGTGTLLEMSHHFSHSNPLSHAKPEGVLSFSAYLQMFNTAAYPNRPDGTLSVTYYDAEKTQKTDFLDTANPTRQNKLDSYVMPLGRWVTIEERVKMNTADANDGYDASKDKKDGLVEVWIDGKKMLSKTHLWRHTTSMKADGFWFRDFYNDRPDLANPPSSDQHVYYDNFRVSTSPLTHK